MRGYTDVLIEACVVGVSVVIMGLIVQVIIGTRLKP